MSKLLHKAVRQKSESAYSVYQQHLANRPVNVSCFTSFCFLYLDIFAFSCHLDILFNLLFTIAALCIS